jgi:dTDP-4-amino-4,6-dideoxygalactose transaminase
MNVRLVDVQPECGLMLTGMIEADIPANSSCCIFIDNNTLKTYDWGEHALRECRRKQISIIEDACQAIGIPGAGSRGDLATFSFSPQKLIATGQGGTVVTNDDHLASRVRELVDHGGDWRRDRLHKRIGGNFRFNDVSARLGLAQLDALSRLLARRQAIRARYREFLPAIDERDAWCVTYRSERAAELVEFLLTFGIEAGMPYPPNNQHAPFRCRGPFPGAEAHYNSTVYLPSHLKMTGEMVGLVCEAILEFEAAGRAVAV